MRQLSLAIISSFVLCHVTDEAAGAAFSYHHEIDEIAKKDMIRIHILNQHREESFTITPQAKTSELYQMAESIGILYPFLLNGAQHKGANEWLVNEETGKLILCDANIQMQEIVPPSLEGGFQGKFQREIKLQVIRTPDLKIAVRIKNGERMEMIQAKATWSTHSIYQNALDSKIMDNIFQFTLCHENNLHQRLSAIPDDQTLEQNLNAECPLELRLKVEQIPDVTLKNWTFRKMLPKQGLSFWRQARVTNHSRYGQLSQLTAKVEGWTGKLDLKFLPPTIKSLVLKGRSVTVDFKHLKLTSLKELVLDFQSIECIDWLSMEDSQLEILLLPTEVKHQYSV